MKTMTMSVPGRTAATFVEKQVVFFVAMDVHMWHISYVLD
jgi:hypothetical protein